MILLFLLSAVSFVYSQTTQTGENKTIIKPVSSNLLDKINLTFDLEGLPKPEDVGFEDAKSKWKFNYELRLSDEKTINDLRLRLYDNCRQNTPTYQKCMSKANKNFSNKLKKVSQLITKGKFEKKGISEQLNREMVIPVKFTSNVVEIFNRANETQENPTFILRVKSKVSAKTVNEKKYNRKQSLSFIYPLKIQRKDGSFDYYNIISFGATVRIYRDNDGIGFGIFKN